MPLVCVVLIFLNEERFEEAVQSVREQTLTDWELVLVDDGSTDRSTLIARDLAAKNERIRNVDHPGHQNGGMSASRNLGVAHATAPYIAFLDADDVWCRTSAGQASRASRPAGEHAGRGAGLRRAVLVVQLGPDDNPRGPHRADGRDGGPAP